MPQLKAHLIGRSLGTRLVSGSALGATLAAVVGALGALLTDLGALRLTLGRVLGVANLGRALGAMETALGGILALVSCHFGGVGDRSRGGGRDPMVDSHSRRCSSLLVLALVISQSRALDRLLHSCLHFTQPVNLLLVVTGGHHAGHSDC